MVVQGLLPLTDYIRNRYFKNIFPDGVWLLTVRLIRFLACPEEKGKQPYLSSRRLGVSPRRGTKCIDKKDLGVRRCAIECPLRTFRYLVRIDAIKCSCLSFEKGVVK